MFNRTGFKKEVVTAFLIAICFIAVTLKTVFFENDVMYYTPAINLASGGGLLTEDIEVLPLKEAVSPKYIAIALYALPMKLGLPWEKVKVLYNITAYFLLALALLNLCARLKINNLALCILFISFGIINDATSTKIAIYIMYSFAEAFTPSYSLAFLSLSFCFGMRKRYDLALIGASVTALLYPHFGITAAMVIGLLFLIDCYIDKKIDFTIWKGALVWIIAMAAVSLPNLSTDMNPLPKEVGSDILARLRGHTSPKDFIAQANKTGAFLLQLLLFLFCAFSVYVRKKAAVESKTLVRDNLIAIVFPLSYLTVLFLMWLGTDVIKSVTITKLMLSKYFPFVCFVLLVPLLKYFDEKVSKGEYFIAALLFTAVCFSSGFAYIMLPVLLCEIYALKQQNAPSKLKTDYKSIAYLLPIFLFWCLFLKYIKINLSFNMPASYIALISIAVLLHLLLKARNVQNFKLLYGICIFALLFLAYTSQKKFSVSAQLRSAATPEIYDISMWLKKNTDAKEKILTNPSWNNRKAAYIPLIAHRDIYVSAKQLPSTNYGFALKAERWRRITNFLNSRSLNAVPPEEIFDFMNEIGYKYLLQDNPSPEFASSLLFKQVLTKGKYVLFEKAEEIKPPLDDAVPQ